jgi:hypothetical protein
MYAPIAYTGHLFFEYVIPLTPMPILANIFIFSLETRLAAKVFIFQKLKRTELFLFHPVSSLILFVSGAF